MDYKIITSTTIDELENKVKEMINNCSDYVVNLKETNNDFNELIKLN
jgi:uncharacterized coiled-coil DUF342 family protein